MDDIRNHDPAPTEEESAFMDANPVGMVLSAVAIAVAALAIGVSASMLLPLPATVPAVAAAQTQG